MKRQGDEREERRGDDFERHDEPRDVLRAILGAEVDLLRRALSADVDHHLVRSACRRTTPPRRARPTTSRAGITVVHQAPAIRRREASDRHPQECRKQHDVREERQEDDRAREPADARQLEKQDEKADEKQIRRSSPNIRCLKFHVWAADLTMVDSFCFWALWFAPNPIPTRRIADRFGFAGPNQSGE